MTKATMALDGWCYESRDAVDCDHQPFERVCFQERDPRTRRAVVEAQEVRRSRQQLSTMYNRLRVVTVSKSCIETFRVVFRRDRGVKAK